MTYQTRSETTGIKSHNTFTEAFAEYKNDQTVWKISFDCMRWRPKTRSEKWSVKSEECLCNLSTEYANENDFAKVYWVWQSIIPEKKVFLTLTKDFNQNLISEEEYENRIDCANIRDVLTEEQFVNNFQFNQ